MNFQFVGFQTGEITFIALELYFQFTFKGSLVLLLRILVMSVFCFLWISDILENDMTHTEYVKKGIKWQQQQCEATLCVR